MKRILIIITTGFYSYGGLATVMLNYYRNMDKSNLCIDFASTNKIDDNLQAELSTNNSKYYELGDRKKHLFKYLNKLKIILLNNNYDVIHVNGNSSTMYFELNIAKKMGIKKRIAHCHTTKSKYPILHYALLHLFRNSYTIALSTSLTAGKWIFKKNFIVINNAINLQHYKFNDLERKKIRCLYNLDNSFVLGNIGKLVNSKNHIFLLKLFSEYLRINPNCKLIIVGGGPLEYKLKKYARDLNIIDNIVFTGMLSETNKIYSAIDLFLFPSKYEGLGMALIEAQASGLHCISSNKVPLETRITNNIIYLPINNLSNWITEIKKFKNNDRYFDSENSIYEITKKGYNIEKEAYKLRKIYVED